MRYSRLYSVLPCAAALALGACSHGSSSLTQAMQPAAAAPAPAAKPAAALVPLPPPTSDERLTKALDQLGARHGARGEVLTLTSTEFGPGLTKLKANATAELQQVAKVLRDYPNADLLIEGYTDNRGNEHTNDKQSLERADAVKQSLMKDGLEVTRMTAHGLGPADPIGDNHTSAGREENRRVELVFSDASGKFAASQGHSAS
ncbi:MAG TPA: OmpA family protein [Steroidobacteraceae bacterium]|nr:OmpA family protein [Steroidobacteraceae bacterium]